MAMNTTQVPTVWVGASDRGITYLVLSTVFVSLAGVSVALRLYARWTQYHRLFPDDYLSIAAQIFAFILMGWAFNFTFTCALGWPVTEVPPAQLERFFKFFYIAELTYGFINPFYKLAVIFLYRRIFGHIRSFNIATWVMTGITIAYGIGGVLSAVFQCQPIDKAWNPTEPGHCLSPKPFILGNGVANIIIDGVILCMPIPVIWSLQLTTTKRLALIGMFLLGGAVCAVSIVRVATLASTNFDNPTQDLTNLAIWSEIEPALGIISACLPTLRQWFWQKFSESYTSRKYGSSRQYSGKKTPLDSIAKSNTAVALTGWNNADAYSEIKGSTPRSTTPPPEIPPYESTGGRGDVELLGALAHEEVDDKSIFVTTELSVRHDHR